MRRLAVVLLLLSGCVLDEIDLANRACDEAHACVTGWVCMEGRCLRCADHDKDGSPPVACGGNDCDDARAAVKPGATEDCTNGLDDDCNGRRDADDPACACVASGTCGCEEGSERACENACAGARQRCTGGTWRPCTTPPETCNGADDDCDGVKDEDFACVLGQDAPCTTTCGSEGRRTCTEGCGWGECVRAEICDGLDDDCDGEKDDGFSCARGTSLSCTTACGSTGTAICGASCEYAADCTPPTETCNGLDDDCDESADESFACVKGASATCLTSCGSSGVSTCGEDCTPGACAAPAEACNGSDDDCDGGADEDWFCVQGEAPAHAPTCTTSCGTPGRLACGASCSAYDGACVAREICNGIDDDCSDGVDEGLSSDPGEKFGTGLDAMAIGARDGVVAVAWLPATGRTVELSIEQAGRPPARATLPVRTGMTPRDVEVTAGRSAVLVAWVESGGTTSELAWGVVSLAGATLGSGSIGAIELGAQARLAWSPAGSAAPFGAAWIASRTPRFATLSEAGALATSSTIQNAPVPAVYARHVALAGTSDGFLAGVVTATKPTLFTPSGQAGPSLTSVVSGATRDDEFELSSDADGTALAAAWTVVGAGDVRHVVVTRFAAGSTTPAALTASPPGGAVAGAVRLAAFTGGAAVTWLDVDQNGDSRLFLAHVGAGSTFRHTRIDAPGEGFEPTVGVAAPVAWDGATWRLAWIDGVRGVARSTCP